MSNARFSILQSRAISDELLSSSCLRTLAALGMYGDKDGWCFPSQATLGKLLHKSRQAVSKDIQTLKTLGYLEVQEQFREDGSQTSNLYRLIFDTKPPVAEGGQPQTLQGEQPLEVAGEQPLEVAGGTTTDVAPLTSYFNAPRNVPRKVPNNKSNPSLLSSTPFPSSGSSGDEIVPETSPSLKSENCYWVREKFHILIPWPRDAFSFDFPGELDEVQMKNKLGEFNLYEVMGVFYWYFKKNPKDPWAKVINTARKFLQRDHWEVTEYVWENTTSALEKIFPGRYKSVQLDRTKFR